MKAVQVTFDGGPLDGKAQTQTIPRHWKFLRYEHLRDSSLHVYFGPVTRSSTVTLRYVGVESQETTNVS